jgi:hypothetical protein
MRGHIAGFQFARHPDQNFLDVEFGPLAIETLETLD